MIFFLKKLSDIIREIKRGGVWLKVALGHSNNQFSTHIALLLASAPPSCYYSVLAQARIGAADAQWNHDPLRQSWATHKAFLHHLHIYYQLIAWRWEKWTKIHSILYASLHWSPWCAQLSQKLNTEWDSVFFFWPLKRWTPLARKRKTTTKTQTKTPQSRALPGFWCLCSPPCSVRDP